MLLSNAFQKRALMVGWGEQALVIGETDKDVTRGPAGLEEAHDDRGRQRQHGKDQIDGQCRQHEQQQVSIGGSGRYQLKTSCSRRMNGAGVPAGLRMPCHLARHARSGAGLLLLRSVPGGEPGLEFGRNLLPA